MSVTPRRGSRRGLARLGADTWLTTAFATTRSVAIEHWNAASRASLTTVPAVIVSVLPSANSPTSLA